MTLHLDDVIMVAIGAFILVVLASIYPAKRAGKLQISKVLGETDKQTPSVVHEA
jgi:ABC-type lipoprotein release transport system permease subunit